MFVVGGLAKTIGDAANLPHPSLNRSHCFVVHGGLAKNFWPKPFNEFFLNGGIHQAIIKSAVSPFCRNAKPSGKVDLFVRLLSSKMVTPAASAAVANPSV